MAIGLALIRKSEDNAAITQLQKLAVTASKNEVVGRLTASKIEVWTPSPTSNIEVGEKLKTACKANNDGEFKKYEALMNSENHTSNIEVLSTVAIPIGQRAFIHLKDCPHQLTAKPVGLFTNLIH